MILKKKIVTYVELLDFYLWKKIISYKNASLSLSCFDLKVDSYRPSKRNKNPSIAKSIHPASNFKFLILFLNFVKLAILSL